VRVKTVVVAASCLSLALAAGARAADWPTYNHDAARSAVTDESLRLPLKTAWTHASPHPPAAAWPDPARHDYWHNKHHLNPRVIYTSAPMTGGSTASRRPTGTFCGRRAPARTTAAASATAA